MQTMNPIIHADFPDPDVVLVNGAYYMTSTTMHVFPGCQVLRSYDMAHWEHCAYVYDTLGETARQRKDEGHIYGKGMWASSIRHHGGLFHVVFTSNDTGHSYHFTAEHAEGPWTRVPMDGFWYDPSVLFDDDGRVYIAHGNRTVRITELTEDLKSPKPGGLDRVVLEDDGNGLGWEGSHFFHIGEWYYLFNIHWPRGKMRTMGCHRAKSLTDTFTGGEFMSLDLDDRHAGVAQGGPIQLADGSFALLLFQDHGAVGRIPVVVPMRWQNGWPVVDEVPKVLDLPSFKPDHVYAPLIAEDFTSPLWQWDHEPHPFLTERTASAFTLMTDRTAANCTQAINTLTQRCFGPKCTCEVTVNGADMHIGDHAGLCALMGHYGQITLNRTEDGFDLVMRTEDGEQVRIPASGSSVRFRADFDFDADTVQFSVLKDQGAHPMGAPHQLIYRLDHFMGCRVGLFMTSEGATGGKAIFTDFSYRAEA